MDKSRGDVFGNSRVDDATVGHDGEPRPPGWTARPNPALRLDGADSPSLLTQLGRICGELGASSRARRTGLPRRERAGDSAASGEKWTAARGRVRERQSLLQARLPTSPQTLGQSRSGRLARPC